MCNNPVKRLLLAYIKVPIFRLCSSTRGSTLLVWLFSRWQSHATPDVFSPKHAWIPSNWDFGDEALANKSKSKRKRNAPTLYLEWNSNVSIVGEICSDNGFGLITVPIHQFKTGSFYGRDGPRKYLLANSLRTAEPLPIERGRVAFVCVQEYFAKLV